MLDGYSRRRRRLWWFHGDSYVMVIVSKTLLFIFNKYL